MRRYKIKDISINHCQVAYYVDDCLDVLDRPVIKDFWASAGGGYVWPQICERMKQRGITLFWPGKFALADLIRKHVRLEMYDLVVGKND